MLSLTLSCGKSREASLATEPDLELAMEEPVPFVVVPDEAAADRLDSLYDIDQSIVPGTWSIAELLRRQVAKSNFVEVLARYLRMIEGATGVRIDLSQLGKATFHLPDRLTSFLVLDLKTIDRGRNFLLAKQRYDQRNKVATTYAYQLPQVFDLGTMDQMTVPQDPLEALREVAPGLYRGWGANRETPDDERRDNTLFAEIIERLMTNEDGDAQGLAPFSLVYRGHSYQNVDTFLADLCHDGYRISAEIRHYVADFGGLWSKDNNGSLHAVAGAIMVHSGFTDDTGMPAIFPMLHSEFFFQFTPPDPTKRAYRIAFSQGTRKTGYLCGNCVIRPQWTGFHVSDTFAGREALRALRLSGRLTNVIRQAARNMHYAADGYGGTGVCNDSVAIIQMAVHGKATPYVLIRKNELLLEEIKRRIDDSGANGANADDYLALQQAAMDVPNDITDPRNVRERILGSLPWQPGQAAFPAVERGRRILEHLRERQPKAVDFSEKDSRAPASAGRNHRRRQPERGESDSRSNLGFAPARDPV